MSPVRTILHTEASLGWGGQEIRVFTEMLALRDRGHRLLLAAPSRSRIHAQAVGAGFQVADLDDRKLAYPQSILRLRALLRRERVEVLNPHSSRDGWLAGLAGRWAGTPLILRSRHVEVDYPNRWSSRLVFGRLPHHVLTTSERISARLVAELGLAPDRVTCIPTGIDLRRFHPGVKPGLALERGWAPSTPVVGMISVLRSWKGHEHFLRAVALLAPRHPEVEWVIVGEGPMRPQVEAWIRELGLSGKVHLLGHRDDVPELLASLSVLVLPSYAHEGVPQIVLQAQAVGRAVIGTTIGGIPEIIRDGETGRLIAPANPEALAAALATLLEQPGLRARLGEAAAEVARQNYGLDVMCRRLESIYDRYLEPRLRTA
jgi:glycosyltransferase involved in cell wall biosynthesis